MGSLHCSEVLACPVPTCHAPMHLGDCQQVNCPRCGESYALHAGVFDLTPSAWKKLHRSKAWEQLQANGVVSYQQAPEGNLGVGKRPDCLEFSRFCRLEGLVLDVGCGPQPWPAYLTHHEPETRFIGIDPLASGDDAKYLRFRALGEYLPFQAGAFDRVLFATSLDHMIDPVAALREAKRVCKPEGQVLLWSGEKKSGAPRPSVSPAWYQHLQVPEGAEDPFHFKRFTEEEVQGMLAAAGLAVTEHAELRVDAWRANHFYRMAAA